MDSKENHRVWSQSISYAQAVADVFYSVLKKNSPLDKELKQYFRMHSECGSRDRFYISESCFSLFRWYGWLHCKMPDKLPESPHLSAKFCCGLSAALWLEQHHELPFFSDFLELANVDAKFMTPAPDDLKGKMKGLGHFFKIRKLKTLQLIPEWISDVIPDNVALEPLIVWLQKRPPVWIRIQNKAHERVKNQFEEKGISFIEHPYCSNALEIKSKKFNAKDFPAYHSGDFEIQDLASQCIGLVCQPSLGETWWDVCAGAGGKSLLLADQMQGKGKVFGTDIREKILENLKMRSKRAGFQNIKIAPLEDICANQEVYDGVLVDAPCSCTGVWRRNPGLRWTTKLDFCKNSAKTQLEICKKAADKVKDGGVLVYATCSISVQENEELVEAFLNQNKSFQLQDFKNPLDGTLVKGMLRINPSPFDNDSMFVARLSRKKD